MGEPVKIQITLTNTSSREIGILRSAAEFDYAIEVRNARGKLVPMTPSFQEKNKPGSVRVFSSNVLYPLKPGDTLTDEVVVTDLYQMANAGKYSVVITRELPEDLGKGTVRSNTLAVTVVP